MHPNGQAIACMIKQNRLTEFNEAFKDIVDCGVFKELSPQDIEEWGGPVNFITLVCAYKSGPHQSTPLRLCMNSSMKQPQPIGKFLNDLLMKGPPHWPICFLSRWACESINMQLQKTCQNSTIVC